MDPFKLKLVKSDSTDRIEAHSKNYLFFFNLPFFQEWPGEVKLIENKYLIFMFLLNGFMFYMQSLTAFGLMSLISPVTFRYVFCCFVWGHWLDNGFFDKFP